MLRSPFMRPPATRSCGCARHARRHSRLLHRPDDGKNREPQNLEPKTKNRNREPSLCLGSCFLILIHPTLGEIIIPPVLGFAHKAQNPSTEKKSTMLPQATS